MFLKQTEFTCNKQSIMLSELTALQRVEYFDHLVRQTELTEQSENTEQNLKRTALYVRMNIESNAFLVSRSLLNLSSDGGTAKELQDCVLNTWPPGALELAAKEVLILSDMQLGTTEEDSTEQNNVPEPAEK